MCLGTVKSPTPRDPQKKDPVYLRNPYLDGLGIGAEAHGRNSLRIDPGSPVPTATNHGPGMIAANPTARAPLSAYRMQRNAQLGIAR